MLVRGWLRTMIFCLAVAHAVALAYEWPLPWAGTLALAALLAYVWLAPPATDRERVPRTALLTGLAALTAVAGLVDARTGGLGWPTALAQPADDPLWHAVEGILLSAASVSLAVAVLVTAGRPRSRRALAAAVAGVALVVGLAVLPMLMWDLYAEPSPWRAALDLAVAAQPLLAVATLGAVAAAAAWAGRRGLGAAATGAATLSGLALLAATEVMVHARLDRPLPPGAFLTPGLSESYRVEAFIVEYRPVDPAVENSAWAVLTETEPRALWPDDVWAAEVDVGPGFVVALWLVGVLAAVSALLAAEDPDDRWSAAAAG